MFTTSTAVVAEISNRLSRVFDFRSRFTNLYDVSTHQTRTLPYLSRSLSTGQFRQFRNLKPNYISNQRQRPLYAQ